MKITNPTVKKLLEHYKEISMLVKIKGLLEWDLNVNLPTKAGPERGIQTAYLAEKITDLWYVPEFREALVETQHIASLHLNPEEQAIVRNLSYSAKYYYNIPKEIIIQKEKLTSEAFPVWNKTKENNDYKSFFPYLKEIIEITKLEAKHLGYKDNPYDALLDLYEPGNTAKFCETTFGKLKKELIILLKKIQPACRQAGASQLINDNLLYSKLGQKRLSHFLMRRMGFDFEAGRLDESPHPFTQGLNRHDIRATTRFKDKDFIEPILSTIHETGHALYEQGVDIEYTGTPLEYGVSLGIHESLSRFWENMVGKDPKFLHFLTPILQSTYPKQLGMVSEDEMIQQVNMVQPSLIRIQADEVTYSLHIILRFEMENELLNGKLRPEDAAEAWKAKSKELLGIEPTTDSDGIMQDVHWTYGAIGYFPAYALGNLYGAQFLSAMRKEVDVDKELSQGNLLPIKGWLDVNIHKHGSLYFPDDLVKKVTGKSLDPQYFVDYLNKKYSKIYGLK
ncbi:MAG TPA: carboxypeptidase M32 [Candidatus Saccharimonadales bacterium]|nr:carboxypeptidase M32 [Candidatus Saccharimonadales bacterium]